MTEEYNLKEGKNGVKLLTSPLFDRYGIPHMFTTRHGGVSEGVFDSLNFSVGQGILRDSRKNVEKNHELAAEALDSRYDDVCRTWQTHSARVEFVTAADRGKVFSPDEHGVGVDGLVAAEPDILLSVRVADCTPVLLFDTENEVCAAVHSGWRGTLNKITENAFCLMQERCGTKPENVIAAVGPSAKSCCYEVGEELLQNFLNEDSDYGTAFKKKGSSLFLSVPTIVEIQVKKLGIPENSISVCNLCTICKPDMFFSHRRDGTERGTMAAFIKLRK